MADAVGALNMVQTKNKSIDFLPAAQTLNIAEESEPQPANCGVFERLAKHAPMLSLSNALPTLMFCTGDIVNII